MTVATVVLGCVSCAQWLMPKTGQSAAVVAETTPPPTDKPSTDKAPPAPTPADPQTAAPTLATAPPSVTAKTAPVPPPPDPGPFKPGKVLQTGSRGEAVLALEKRLESLRYDVGAVDGYYDRQTWQAVMAFQKYADLKRTGSYTLETQKALHKATLAEGRHPDLGLPRIEIDIPRQVLLYFDEAGLSRVLAVSTGSNRKYCEISKKSGKQVCGVAQTPRGQYHIQYRIPGWRESDLGKLYNPLYFNGGFAIHGAPSVPAYNASHGCVRISVDSSKWFYGNVKNGTPVIIFD